MYKQLFYTAFLFNDLLEKRYFKHTKILQNAAYYLPLILTMKALPVYLLIIAKVMFFQAFCQAPTLKPQGIYTSNFNIDERPRSITYYTPANYGKIDTATYSLLVFLHDDKSSAKNLIKSYGDLIHQKADANNCVVLYPDAIYGHWNSKQKQLSDSVNDVAFISIMIDYFIQQYRCNLSRIYLAGIGNGGSLCYRINCETPYKIRTLTPINAIANEFQNCRAKEATRMLDIKNQPDLQTSINKALAFLFTNNKSN